MADTELTPAEQKFFDTGGETDPNPSATDAAVVDTGTPKPDTAPAAVPKEGQGEQQNNKTVPLAALHEEREARKTLKAELETERKVRGFAPRRSAQFPNPKTSGDIHGQQTP